MLHWVPSLFASLYVRRSPSTTFESSEMPVHPGEMHEPHVGQNHEAAEKEGPENQVLQSSWQAHIAGSCKPCNFFAKLQDGCRLGAACRFCHFGSPEEAKRRINRLNEIRKKARAAIRRPATTV